MSLIGFLFLFILVTLFAGIAYGNDIDDFDSDDRLQKINNNPKKFKISIVIAVIEWVRIIALAIMFFSSGIFGSRRG